MPVFQALDPEIAWKLIEGHEDVVSAEARALDAFYRQFRCPRCREALVKEFDARHAFGPGNDGLVAHALLRCENCRFLLEPHTNIVLESGNASKIPVESSPLILGPQYE